MTQKMPLLTTVPRALQTESATVALPQKKKKKNPESYIMDKKSFVTPVSCKITNTAPHSKTQTHTSATA